MSVRAICGCGWWVAAAWADDVIRATEQHERACPSPRPPDPDDDEHQELDDGHVPADEDLEAGDEPEPAPAGRVLALHPAAPVPASTRPMRPLSEVVDRQARPGLYAAALVAGVAPAGAELELLEMLGVADRDTLAAAREQLLARHVADDTTAVAA